MDDKSSLLKIKLYLFSSANADQRQDQKHLTIKDKKDRSLSGRPSYASYLEIGRNPYDGKINPDKFSENLKKAKQLIERQYYKECDKNTLSKSRQTELSG